MDHKLPMPKMSMNGEGVVKKKEWTGMEIVKQPKFLSPSSLWAFENMPNKFFLERMAINPRPKERQGIAAAAGTAFDAEVKLNICNHALLKKKLIDEEWDKDKKAYWMDKDVREIAYNMNIEPQNREEVSTVGKYLFSEYSKYLFNKAEYSDVEIARKMNIGWEGTDVPLYGKLDALVYDVEAYPDEEFDGALAAAKLDANIIPLDWKVSGYSSKSTMSPKPGFMLRYRDGEFKGSHNKYHTSIPMSAINEQWATQCCVYGWMAGRRPFEDFYAIIDNIIIRPGGLDMVRYRALIDREFQIAVAFRFYEAWTKIKSGEILERVAASHRLFAEVAANNERWW